MKKLSKDKLKKPQELLRRVFKTYQDEYFAGKLHPRKLIPPKPIVIELDRDLANSIANYLYNHNDDFQEFHNRKMKEREA